jgi:hypothetical protein
MFTGFTQGNVKHPNAMTDQPGCAWTLEHCVGGLAGPTAN